jgi:hypothetical protein
MKGEGGITVMMWNSPKVLLEQKYLQKQGWTLLHQLCASISSGSGSTFNVRL